MRTGSAGACSSATRAATLTRAEVHQRAREVLAAFLAAHPAFAIPPDQVEATAELLSHGLAAIVLWWGEHPDVPRTTLVDVATRVVAGLATARA